MRSAMTTTPTELKGNRFTQLSSLERPLEVATAQRCPHHVHPVAGRHIRSANDMKRSHSRVFLRPLLSMCRRAIWPSKRI
jgi:hypothetical protein